jgi:DEAD/DEAH box helicase domain-containing protein
MMAEAARTMQAGTGVDDPVRRLVRRLQVRYAGRITGGVVLPEHAAQLLPLPGELDPRLAAALRTRGIQQLYSHQRAAWDAVTAGRHTVVVTPTASGKTLCYNLPVLQAALADRAKALYLFPTKALSQDQVAELMELNEAGNLGVRAFTFDGDTPGDARRAVRTRGDIVVSNPDMLHQGVLPHHTKWAQFFENLRFVVIDEMHTYRGVFGSHVANVIRRLRRVCRFYGSNPVFVLSSATIANPGELAEGLIGEPVTAITESGAPTGERHLLLWNPPVVNADLGIRASARSQATRIARMAVKSGLKTIVFAQSRLMVEVLTKYLKDVFDADPRRPARVAAYRGGYLPGQRRETEKALRAGNVDCVIATSALELGVDIGSLDVCVLNGYPGTIAATWQRLGRAGRRQRPSLGVLVATSQPLDQYIIRNPDFFLGSSPEHARIDPDQLLILLDHVRCAAFELPFRRGDRFGKENLEELLGYLEEHGVLHREDDTWHWTEDSYPAQSVSLRSVAEGNFVVVDSTGGGRDIIAEVDYSSAAETIYEGAIYMVQAQPYQVERLDWAGRKAFVTRTAGRLLHRCDRLHAAEDPGPLREPAGRAHRDRAWRGAPGAAHPRLQEDPLLQSREHRLRQHRPAGPGDAHDRCLVGGRAGGADGVLCEPAAGAGRLPRRSLCDAPRGGADCDVRAAGHRPRGGRWRRPLVRDRGRRRARPDAPPRRRGTGPRSGDPFPAGGLPVRQLPRRRRPGRTAVRPARAGDRGCGPVDP